MKIIIGNLIDFAEQGHFDVIVHGCNCFHKMGAGIAKEIARRYPKTFQIDLTTGYGDDWKLGTYSKCFVQSNINDNRFWIINGYTQYWYGKKNLNKKLNWTSDNQRYDFIKNVFSRVSIEFPDKRIGYPKIGAGLAGGDWNIISKIIDVCLNGLDHTLVIL